MPYQALIGLEVHVQLLTETKMFCPCPNRFGAEPNTLICPVCVGYPGALPVVNSRAVDLALKLSLSLGCRINSESIFARKNYFYPDLPKGYQISQYDRPLSAGGRLPLGRGTTAVRIARLHLEEDAGKLLHEAPGGRPLPGLSLVDFNRCGVPLVEIVSEPDIKTPREAQDFLQSLRQLLLYTGTSDGNMEEGSLRCDANVSVRRRGDPPGARSEIKNLNSFRNTARALEYEIQRQIDTLERGGQVAQETRGYDEESGCTRPLRVKEEAHDYRYFPEPDLPPLVVSAERIAGIRVGLEELPWGRRDRMVEQHSLSLADATVLTGSRELADYFESAAALYRGEAKSLANWVMTEILRELKQRRQDFAAAIPPARLVALLDLVDSGAISRPAAKRVLREVWDSGEEPRRAVERLGLSQVADENRLRVWIDEVVAEHREAVDQYRAGSGKVLGFLVGQVMKRSAGKAEPHATRRMLRRMLAEPSAGRRRASED